MKSIANCEMMLAQLPMLEGAVEIEARLFFEAPASDPMRALEDWHTSKPDADNCLKNLKDSMNKVVFRDDCQVAVAKVAKLWSREARVEVIVRSLSGEWE